MTRIIQQKMRELLDEALKFSYAEGDYMFDRHYTAEDEKEQVLIFRQRLEILMRELEELLRQESSE